MKKLIDKFRKSPSTTGKTSFKIGGSFAGIGLGVEAVNQGMDVSQMLVELGASPNLVAVMHYLPLVFGAISLPMLIFGAYKTGMLKELLPDLISILKKK
jgi:hypothetical protein